jgi:hypothetical protein
VIDALSAALLLDGEQRRNSFGRLRLGARAHRCPRARRARARAGMVGAAHQGHRARIRAGVCLHDVLGRRRQARYQPPTESLTLPTNQPAGHAYPEGVAYHTPQRLREVSRFHLRG